uniref:Reverse transcriptase N-terminal domain-containing protein n=1 Tax=Candidatus Methanogaster sp. ANME-2c ERB4 TaxID=2759911 RepID=A0A7G9YPF4_9EURY|nr:hypothetical protein GKKIKBAN_00002 [Methanosarcinales archaeon ANME-2c ERB4]
MESLTITRFLDSAGIDKKRMTSCNEVHRGSKFALTRNGADPIVVVSHCMNGGKPVNVSNSITPSKGEKLTDKRSKPQWTNVDWDGVEKHVSRLQTRIAKAVNERKWHLVRRKKRPLSTPTMTVRTMQMLHALRTNLEGDFMVVLMPECHRNKLLPDTERVMRCLSGMKGNFLVPF